MRTAAEWLERARTEGTPLLDNDQATFVWFGDKAPVLMGDFNLWGIGGTPYPVMQAAAPNVWTYTLPLLPHSYHQYTFTRNARKPKARLIDPFNQHPAPTGFGEFNASFQTADFRATVLPTRRRPMQGRLGRFRIRHPFMLLGAKRDVWLYQPPAREPVPLLLVYDAQDAVHTARLAQLVDYLITTRQIQPIALACIANARQHRFTEYAMSEALLTVVLDQVLPLAHKHLTLLDTEQVPGAYGVMGASLGGLMALYTGLRLSHIFGKVISQSGSYQLALDERAPLLPSLLWRDHKPLTIWQDVGRYEWLYTVNERVHAELADAGYDVTYRVYNSGHNWHAWHAILPDALQAMFGDANART